MKGSQIVDLSVLPGDKQQVGFLVPVVGIHSGLHVDYDRNTETLYWVEAKDDESENVSQKFQLLHRVLSVVYLKNVTFRHF